MNNWCNDTNGETRVIGRGGGGGCLSTTLSTTNPMWTGLALNPGLQDERASNYKDVSLVQFVKCDIYTVRCKNISSFVIAAEHS
jgi:hypothetical protein